MRGVLATVVSIGILMSCGEGSADGAKLEVRQVDSLTMSITTLFREGRYVEALTAIEELRQVVRRENERSATPVNSTPAARKQKSPLSLISQGHELSVYFGVNTIYRLQDSPGTTAKKESRRSRLSPLDDELDRGRFNRIVIAEDRQEIFQNRYVKISGETRQVRYVSSAPEVVTVDEGGSLFVKGAGSAVVTVQVGEDKVSIHYTVVDLPLYKGMSQTEVIKKLGLPDRRHEETWQYDAFPTVELSFWPRFDSLGPSSDSRNENPADRMELSYCVNSEWQPHWAETQALK